MKKAQETLIGFLMLVMIGLAIMTMDFGWAWPAIQKAQNMDEAMRLENRMIELHNAVKKAASEQGMLTVPFTIKKGMLYLDNNNSIVMKSFIDLPQVFQEQTVFGNKTMLGVLGSDEPGYLLKRGAVEFELHYINLNNTNTGKCYGIKLISGNQGAAGRGEHTVFDKWVQENSTTVAGCSSTIHEVVSINIE